MFKSLGGHTIKPLFAKSTLLSTRFLILSCFSIALMLVDARFDVLKPVRSNLGMVLTPLYWLGDLPVRTWTDTAQMFSSRTDLLAENEALRAETLLMQRRLQKLATLTEQNVRLRELLNSSALIDDRVLVAELIGIDPNPHTHRVLINKGSSSGVILGAASAGCARSDGGASY